MTSAVSTNNIFENNFEIQHNYEKYLKGGCQIVPDSHSLFKYFLNIGFVREISPERSDGFGRCRH